MKQNIVKSFGPLTNLGTNIVGGLTQLEEALGIVHVPKVKVETDLMALITGNTAYQNSRLLLSNRREALRVAAKDGREFIIVTRDMFKPRFGSQPSIDWLVLGFQPDSLAAPESPEDTKPVLRAIKTYLAANPTFELPALQITAARAQALLDALNDAEVAMNIQDSTLGNLRDARETALNTLDGTIRSFIAELGVKLAPLDSRWKAFGLNIPGADETPDQVVGVKVTLIGPTAAAVKWEASPRAEYYRVWTKIHGTNGDYVAVGSPADLDFTIENLPANATIDIVITAVNNGGESPVSELITVTTH